MDRLPLAALVFMLFACCGCGHSANVRDDKTSMTSQKDEAAGEAEPGPTYKPEPAAEPAPEPEPAPAPAPAPDETAPEPIAAPEQAADTSRIELMSQEEVRALVNSTISDSDGLQRVIADMSGHRPPVISIERLPDRLYPYYNIYVGAESGEHAWRLFTFILDPRTRTLKVECTDVTGFTGGTVNDFVSAWSACENIETPPQPEQ